MNSQLLAGLRQQAYDRYLALWLAPAAARDFLLALFSLERELQSLPHKVANPTLGVMRVTWWRDAILTLKEKPAPANPVLQALAPYAAKAGLLADYAETFDEAFYEDGRAPRIAQRADFMAVLLADMFAVPLPELRGLTLKIYGQGGHSGRKPASLAFLADVAGKRLSALRLAIKALRYSLFG